MLFVLLTVAILLIASSRSYSGELQFFWSNYLDSGGVLDMEFMPDNNQFIMGTTFDVQIRNTATGEQLQVYPFFARDIEFTPDSTKLISVGDRKIQLRNLSDMILLKEYNLPDGTDTTDLNYEVSVISCHKLLVDPIRPLCYTLRVRSGKISNNQNVNIQKIIIYNYETMEEVGKLTSPAEETSYYKDIAISKDGRYLAAITVNTSFIKVWDLNTRQKIRDFKVCDAIPKTNGGQPDQIEFSTNNTDDIFFNGIFPQTKENIIYDGLFKYNISTNKIVDSTFGVGEKKMGYGRFCLFDNEERAIYPNWALMILNLHTKIFEQKILYDTISIPNFNFGDMIYSPIHKFIISFSSNGFSCMKNNLSTFIPIKQSIEAIYPNPATGKVNIETKDNLIKGIRIYNANGVEVSQGIDSRFRRNDNDVSDGVVQLNVSNLPSGEYFIVLDGKERITYKLIINK